MADKFTLPVDMYNQLLEDERNLVNAIRDIDTAEECGIECQHLRDATSNALVRISKLKQHYAPADLR